MQYQQTPFFSYQIDSPHLDTITSLATIRLPEFTDVLVVSPYGVKISRWLVCKFTADQVLQTTAMMNNAVWGRPLMHRIVASLKMNKLFECQWADVWVGKHRIVPQNWKQGKENMSFPNQTSITIPAFPFKSIGERGSLPRLNSLGLVGGSKLIS